MNTLCKKVFCDDLGWVDGNSGNPSVEIVALDSHFTIYILYRDEKSRKIAGGARLMPTNGPTLLRQVWEDMLPDAARFHSSDVWEVTRFCIDETVSSRKNSLLNEVTHALSVTISKFTHVNNICEVVAISQRYFFNMSSVFGPKAEIISSKIESDGTEILCGVWLVAEIP